jgi:hypothetical protein
MSDSMHRPCITPLFAGAAVAALLIGWAAGAGAQTTDPSPPQQQASLPASGSTANPPSLPLGHDDVREVQNQLIALGFDPGPADGQAGPATIAAAQQYDQSRGGSGQVSIDAELLARLKADSGPRLTYDQVAARSQSRARSQAQSSAPAAASNQFGNVVQQIAPILGAVIANSNNNRGYGYGPGYYGPGPGYYGPPPGYYGYGYGGY